MALSNIIEKFAENRATIGIVLVVVTGLIQIAPIKLNPWSWLLKSIRKLFLGDVMKKIDEVTQKLEQHIEEENAKDLRIRRDTILDFASAVLSGRKYTREQYEQMVRECDEYHQFCIDKHFKNSVIDESIEIIKGAYIEQLHQKNSERIRVSL